jgi:hypothetical protein
MVSFIAGKCKITYFEWAAASFFLREVKLLSNRDLGVWGLGLGEGFWDLRFTIYDLRTTNND